MWCNACGMNMSSLNDEKTTYRISGQECCLGPVYTVSKMRNLHSLAQDWPEFAPSLAYHFQPKPRTCKQIARELRIEWMGHQLYH